MTEISENKPNNEYRIIEKYSADMDILAVKINGKLFKIHAQNHIPAWNSAPQGNPERIIELKNLMISGTLYAGTKLKTIEIVTFQKGASTKIYSNRNCTDQIDLNSVMIQSGEQVFYIKVVDPNGDFFQVYTLSIMGLDGMNSMQYYKYGEPTFVADSYQTWIWALQNAYPGQIIALTKSEQFLYKPGENQFNPLIENKQDLVIRSVSGNNKDLILHGHGFHKGGYRNGLPHDELFVVSGANTKDIVVYGITVMESTANGFKLNGYGEENIVFDNCRMIDINERALKGSGPQIDGKFTRSKNISILNCLFENTQIPVESDHDTGFSGDYISGVDVMNISGLTISGNIFKNIIGKNNGARGVIFVWGQDGCNDVLIENNIIDNCDKGIALGNYSGNPEGNSIGGFYTNGVIIRNNIITNTSYEFIELNRVNDVKIFNNTLWKADASHRGIRDSGGSTYLSHNISIVNNIVRGAVDEFPRGNNIHIGHNIFDFNELPGVVLDESNISFEITGKYFVNTSEGDFRLKKSTIEMFTMGIPLVEVETDFSGTNRGLRPVLGAYQK